MLYKGDDTNAFDNKFLTIELENPNGIAISKAELRCGNVSKTFDNPQFPLQVDLSSEDTKALHSINTCYLAIYDELGRKRTCKGQITFTTKERVV